MASSSSSSFEFSDLVSLFKKLTPLETEPENATSANRTSSSNTTLGAQRSAGTSNVPSKTSRRNKITHTPVSNLRQERRQNEENRNTSRDNFFVFSNDSFGERNQDQWGNVNLYSQQSQNKQNLEHRGRESRRSNWRQNFHRGRGNYQGYGRNQNQENQGARMKNHNRSRISNASSVESLDIENVENERRQYWSADKRENNDRDKFSGSRGRGQNRENQGTRRNNRNRSRISNASSVESLDIENLGNERRQEWRADKRENNDRGRRGGGRGNWKGPSSHSGNTDGNYGQREDSTRDRYSDWKERDRGGRKDHVSRSDISERNERMERGESTNRQSPRRNKHQNKFYKYPLPKNNNNNDNDNLYRIPYRYLWLVQLSEMSGSDIATQLVNSQSGFKELINNKQLMKDKPDVLILIMKLLAKVADADFKENKNKIFTQACDIEFLDEIATFMLNIATKGYTSTIFDINNFLKDVLTFTKGVLISLPLTAAERFKKILVMVETVERSGEVFQQVSISYEVKNMKETLLQQLKEVELKQKNDEVKMTSRIELLSARAPPNNFREINLIPTVHDIFSRRPFVRPNLIKGAYSSVEHYLDVQFRLLHEDFLSPMREGIGEYMQTKGTKKGKFSNVRIYRNVMFLSPRVVTDRVGIVVNFDTTKRMKKMNWKNSKRFMYGSLLCFTQDNFRSIIFGTVVERNEKDLEMSQIVVELCDGSQMRDDLFKAQFTMAESEVYFEPYHQVLKALREMQEEEFPMKHYIVEAQQETLQPEYLLNDVFPEYIMKPNFRLPVNYPHRWPTAEALDLDESQYRAFKLALTKEFVVIQGPPGTGKTFLGLKVAGVMLENSEKWNADKQPMLVVCYTNHALDQFLEGLLQHTEKIVRVGGQSKNEAVNAFNLKELRKEYKKWMYNPKSNDLPDMDREQANILRARLRMNTNLSRDIHDKLEQLVSKIKEIQFDLEKIEKNEGIISSSALQEFMHQHHYSAFLGTDDRDEHFVEWLLSPEENQASAAQVNVQNEEQGSDEEEDDDEFLDDTEERGFRDRREDLDLNVKEVSGRLRYSTSIDMMKFKMAELQVSKEELQEETQDPIFYHSVLNVINRQIADLEHKSTRLEQRLKERIIARREDVNRILAARNIWELNYNDRWILYRHWVSELKEKLLEQFKEQENEFSTDARHYEEVRQAIDLEIMRNSLIVGMTTTGAARLQSLLKALKPKIVIVEEAAEVLESHILVSLTNHCQHLILIGDHKQLRPSTSVYRLAKDFNLDVSLFERMLNNGMHCEVLKVQHRMRPEIASLIVPSIYPELLNHQSVTLFDQIQGVSKNLFFLDHTHPDEEAADTFSHRNVHEALFMVALCRHLVLQGYEPDKITILSTYAAQMFLIRNESKKYDLLKGVRITVVDNFQGEESDIILLSLVRSNQIANIGFLKIENRVCVALSRARKGMYIMGNMENLTRSSNIWPKIKESLEYHDAIGSKLELQCQVHPDQRKLVSKAQDFANIPEGGCTLECKALLGCGHTCQSVCHARDREHKNYKCRVFPCNRVLCVLGHRCQKLCFQECGDCKVPVRRKLRCGHERILECHVDYEKLECRVLVKKIIPSCSHEVDVPCCVDPAKFSCPIPCEARLDECGHSCRRKCHVTIDPDHLNYECMQPCARTNKGCSQQHPCTKKCSEECGLCEVKVWKVIPACRHKCQMACHKDPALEICKKDCVRTMACGHRCKKKCFERCGDCNVAVTKKIPICGHEIQLRCSTVAEHSMCRSPCERSLPCGHRCKGICGQPCIAQCMEIVPYGMKSECGHIVNIPCCKRRGLLPNSQELLSYCTEPCRTILQCTHPCVGTCSQCLQGRIHVSCNQKCGRPQICGHSCNTPCAVTCPPCNKKCTLRCRHNKCMKNCGEPCTPCKEPCGWSCEHHRCSKQCSDPCDRPPCSEPCQKKIKKCGHPCIGFCGEPCPRLCRICDEDEVTTVVLGNEDEEDARFVLLEDCKHIVEHRDLETWLKITQEDQGVEITMPTCPYCKTMITKNVRYSNLIKERYTAVCEVKKRVFGELKQIERSRNQNMQKLKELAGVVSGEDQNEVQIDLTIRDDVLHESKHFVPLFERLVESCNVRTKKNRRNVLSNLDVETQGIQISIIAQLASKAKKVKQHLKTTQRATMLQHMDLILNVLLSRNKHLSIQEVEDLNLEVQRFHRIADVCVLESMPQFPVVHSQYREQFANLLKKPLMSIEKYSMERDRRLERFQDYLSRIFKATGLITKEERSQIVKALGMSPGHWYKCPNGHYYIITECGGAMQIGRCNECNEQIGGTQHTLLNTNRHAGEMDGSNFAAWSDAANMANYRFDDF